MTWYDGSPAPDPRHEKGAVASPALPPGAAAPPAASPGAALPGALAWGAVTSPSGGQSRRAPGEERHPGAPSGGLELDERVPPDAARGASGRARLRAAARAAAVPVAAADDDAAGGSGAWLRDGTGASDPGEDDDPPAERQRLVDVVRWRVAPRTAAIALGALLLVGGAVAVRSAAQATGVPVVVEEPAVTPSPATAAPDGSAGQTAEEAVVRVHVVGQVATPGVVALPAGSRVGDAVAAAGGALPDADLAGLNLAAVVQDGVQIRVPAPGEEPAPGTGDGASGVSGAGVAGGGGAAGGALDVNTAGSTELQTLPGIGSVLADRIVAFREANGPFASVDALLDVSGIGPAVLGQIRDLVRV